MSEFNKKPDLIGYLYGELTEEERRAVEQWLRQHPEAQQELDELQETRSRIAHLPEVQPSAPMYSLPVAQTNVARRRWVSWAGVAAAAILVLLVVLNTSITVSKQGMTIAFGQPILVETPAPTPVDNQQWKEQLTEALALNNALFEQQLDSIQQKLQQQLAQNQQVLLSRWQTQSVAQDELQRQKLEEFATTYYQKSIPGIAANLQTMQLQQRQEFQLMLNELWNDWLTVRRADLQVIQTNMQNLQQNVELNRTQTKDLLENMLVRLNY